MRQSMTGYASGEGGTERLRWVWEIRGVNGKALDLRFRLPDGIEGLDAILREQTRARLARGSITIGLRLAARGDGSPTPGPKLSEAHLAAVIDAMGRIDAAAQAAGLALAPSTAADIVGLRGMLDAEPEPEDGAALKAALVESFPPVLDAFVATRAAEGAALARILSGQIDEIAALTDRARAHLAPRQAEQRARLEAQLGRVMAGADGADPDRVAQELALIVVKQDVTEELDRLETHVAWARALLAEAGPIGRKLDFLSQEFNREANTLCSKAQHAGLTEIGLALKTVIDQLREQVQNVE